MVEPLDNNNQSLLDQEHNPYKSTLITFIDIKLPNISSIKTRSKIVTIINTLNSTKIDYGQLKKQTLEGIPDDIPSLRSLLWKIFLDQLSLNASQWDNQLLLSRQRYQGYKEKYVSKVNEAINKPKDHPLSLKKESVWKEYFKDNDLLEMIDKDIKRTQTHMNFFFMPCKSSFGSNKVSGEQILKAAVINKNDSISNKKKNAIPKDFETNADVMKRILYIYGKLNPDTKYVQGMNELLAPIFFCFSHDQNPDCIPYLEADAFTCFENLMKKVSSVFLRIKDNDIDGINSKMKLLNKMIKMFNLELYTKLEKENIDIHFYAFRWLTLFFTQDFEMPDVQRLWDVILSEEDLFEFVYMISIGILNIKCEEILEGEFSTIMELILNFEKLDAEMLIREALIVRDILNSRV